MREGKLLVRLSDLLEGAPATGFESHRPYPAGQDVSPTD